MTTCRLMIADGKDTNDIYTKMSFAKVAHDIVALKQELFDFFELLEAKNPDSVGDIILARSTIEVFPERAFNIVTKRMLQYRKYLEEEDFDGFFRAFRSKNTYACSVVASYARLWNTCTAEEIAITRDSLKRFFELSKRYRKHAHGERN